MMNSRSNIKNIGVFTSGGDSPGMNACIRAVVRTANFHGIQTIGVLRGFEGMITNSFKDLNIRSVSNIIQRGGTILKSARCKEFHERKHREIAFKNLEQKGIDGLIAIGGDGTFTGASIFSDEFGIPVIGIPGTIDNDLFGTDYTIGFDTAVNTAVEAIDKIRDTAASHDRIFFIEVMGRDAGYIALHAGIAGGSESILLPETKTDIDQLVSKLQESGAKGKTSNIIVVAEGDDEGGANEIAEKVRAKCNEFNTRVTILGHIQRGGSPSAFDRILSTRFGVASVERLLDGSKSEMVGLKNNKISFTSLEKAIKYHVSMDKEMIRQNMITSI